MLDDFASFIKSKDVYTCIIVVAWPLLKAVQHRVILLGNNPLKGDALAWVLGRHVSEIVDKGVLAICYMRVMLNIYFTRVAHNRLGGLALVKHQVVEGDGGFLITLEFVH